MDQEAAGKQCRTCLSQDDEEIIYCSQSFVSECGQEISYLDCYQFCTQLEATADHLPSTICYKCAAKMRDTYAFIQRAKESNKILLTQAASVTPGTLKESELKVEDSSIEEEQEDTLSPEDMLPIKEEIVDEQDKDKTDESANDRPILENQDLGSNAKHGSPVKRRRRRSNVNCEICNVSFPRGEIRQHHKLKHRPEMFLCHACPLTFKAKSNLRRHELTHAVRKRNYTCNICGKKFLRENYWRGHAKVHDEDREPSFKCDYCDKAFFYKFGLKLHMQEHTGKTFECELCFKKYARIHDLKIHMRTHTGERPFKCQFCEMDFAKKSRLKAHEEKHQGIRYKCDFCDKDYRGVAELLKHRTSHTGYPYKCAICNKGFCNSFTTRRHITGVHKFDESKDISEYVIKVETKKCIRRPPGYVFLKGSAEKSE